MKLVFLDFDGVLNSHQWFNHLHNKTKDDKLVLVETDDMLDPDAVERVNKLVEKTGAKVVISSSWRILHSLESLNTILKKFGARFEAIDVTLRLHEERGIEIQTYLDSVESKGFAVEAFVILDDDSDMAHLRNTKHFVKTTFKDGFTDWHLEEAIKVLT